MLGVLGKRARGNGAARKGIGTPAEAPHLQALGVIWNGPGEDLGYEACAPRLVRGWSIRLYDEDRSMHHARYSLDDSPLGLAQLVHADPFGSVLFVLICSVLGMQSPKMLPGRRCRRIQRCARPLRVR